MSWFSGLVRYYGYHRQSPPRGSFIFIQDLDRLGQGNYGKIGPESEFSFLDSSRQFLTFFFLRDFDSHVNIANTHYTSMYTLTRYFIAPQHGDLAGSKAEFNTEHGPIEAC